MIETKKFAIAQLQIFRAVRFPQNGFRKMNSFHISFKFDLNLNEMASLIGKVIDSWQVQEVIRCTPHYSVLKGMDIVYLLI